MRLFHSFIYWGLGIHAHHLAELIKQTGYRMSVLDSFSVALHTFNEVRVR